MAFEAGTAFIPILPVSTNFIASLKKQITPALAALQAQGVTAGKAIGTAFTAGGIAIGVGLAAATVKGIADFQRLGAEVRTLELQLGTTAEQASVLNAQAHALGISTDDLSRGFGIFSKNLVNGSSALQKYGITAERTATGQVDFEATLVDIAQKFQALPPGIDKTAFAMNLFGRSGKTLIPLLNASSDELASFAEHAKAAGLIMSQDDVDAARALGIASRQLHESFQGLSVALARAVVPALTSIANALSKMVTFITPVLPQIRDLFLIFVAYKGLTFLPGLLTAITVSLENLGLSAAAVSVSNLVPALEGLAAAAGPFTLIVGAATAVGFSLRGLIGIFQPYVSATEAAAGETAKLAAGLADGSISIAQGRAEIAKYNATIGALPGVADLSAAAILKEALATKEMAAALSQANITTHEFITGVQGLGAGISAIATDTGSSFASVKGDITGLVHDTTDALAKNEKAAVVWNQGVKAQLDSVRQAFAAFRAQTATSLDFVAQQFSTTASDFTGSANEIARGLQKALQGEQGFARDINTILKDASPGAKLLAEQLIALGPAGATAAAKIAGANDKIRASIEGALRKGQQFAQDTATVLQHKLLGALTDIRTFFDNLTTALEKTLNIDINDDGIIGATTEGKKLGATLAEVAHQSYDPKVTVDTSQGTAAVGVLQAKLNTLGSHPYTASVFVKVFGAGGLPFVGWATGFHGTVTKPTLALVGEHGPERVDVGPGGVSTGPGRIHGQLAITDWHRGVAVLDGELDNLDRTSGR